MRGEANNTFYIIKGGKVAILVGKDPAAEEPEGQTRPAWVKDGERQVATLASGKFFGERALLKREPANATVRAMEPVSHDSELSTHITITSRLERPCDYQ